MDIAVKCDISKGTLYYYYRSKNELIMDINEWNMNKITSGLLELLDTFIANGKGFTEILPEVFKAVSGAEIRGRMHLYLINEAISKNPDLIIKLRESYREWFDILERAFEKILTDFEDPEALARAIVASIDGIMIQNILSIGEIPMDRVVSTMVSGYGE